MLPSLWPRNIADMVMGAMKAWKHDIADTVDIIPVYNSKLSIEITYNFWYIDFTFSSRLQVISSIVLPSRG